MRTIFKYNNRKLYDTHLSDYTTVSSLLEQLPINEFKIISYKDKVDVTEDVLLAALSNKDFPRQYKIDIMLYIINKPLVR